MVEGEIDHRATRRDFRYGSLSRSDLDPDPWRQMQRWLDDAQGAGNYDPTAMALATANAQGAPSVRYVLLKHFDHRGLCWYSDARSRKGQDLDQNAQAAVSFYWPETDRQVRAEGRVERLPEGDAEAYFRQRPVGSRLAAAASHQSQVVANRAALESRMTALAAQYPAGDVPRNPAWGGYRLIPQRFEFWQGRPNRLHDRFAYRRGDSSAEDWVIERLMP